MGCFTKQDGRSAGGPRQLAHLNVVKATATKSKQHVALRKVGGEDVQCNPVERYVGSMSRLPDYRQLTWLELAHEG